MGCAASTPAEVQKLHEVVSKDSSYSGPAVPTKPADVSALKRLCLADCKTLEGEEGGATLALALAHFKSIEEIDVSRCPLGALGIMSLEGVMSQGIPKNLKTLVLASTVESAGGTAITRLAAALKAGEFTGLTVLDLGYNTIKPNGAMALAQAIRENKPPLQEVILPDCHIGGSGAHALAGALAVLDPSLRIKLDLFSNQIAEMGGAAIGELLATEEAPRVTHLSLQNSAFGSTGLVQFAVGLKSPNVAATLEALDLSGNGIGNHDKAGCAALTDALSTNPPTALRILNLAENTLHYGDAEALLESLKHAAGLTWLDLSHNSLRAEACAPLQVALDSLVGLETLGLNENPRLEDEGVAALLGVLQSRAKQLRALHVCNTGMGDASKSATLALLGKGGVLKHVDVRANGALTSAAVEELRGAAPATVELILPGDDGKDTMLGLDTRKMWFQWVGEAAFIPKGGGALSSTRALGKADW